MLGRSQPLLSPVLMPPSSSPWRTSPTHHLSQRSLTRAASTYEMKRSRISSASRVNVPTIDLGHGLFDEERRWAKQPTLLVAAPWSQVTTDRAWISLPANQIDPRCEAMKHVQSNLPEGNTAAERRQAKKKPLPMYGSEEASRFALHNTLPPAHDLLYRTSSMPVGVGLLANYHATAFARRPRRLPPV